MIGFITLELRCPGERRGELAFYAPKEYRLDEASGGESTRQRGNLLIVTVPLVDRAFVRFRFTPPAGAESRKQPRDRVAAARAAPDPLPA